MGALAILLLGALVTALAALGTAAPVRWMAREVLRRWRIPLLALAVGVLSWRAAAAAESFWGVLSDGTLHGVACVLRHFSNSVIVDPGQDLIGVGDFEVIVAPVCSGVDGIGLVVLFEAVWISLARSRLRLPRALLLLPLGALAAWAANVIRIAALILVGASGRVELAVGGLHSKLGWILFIAIALGSVALAERVAWLQRPGAVPDEAEAGVPPAAAAYVVPLLAALATALVTSIWTEGPLDLWYGLRIAAAVAALLLMRRSLPGLSLSPSWVPALLGIAVCAIWIPFGGTEAAELAGAIGRLGQGERWTWIALRIAGSVLVIPLVEELAFRGFLLPWLVSPEFESAPPRAWTWPAVILSSLAFGAIHQQWVLGAVAGLAFAAARLYRGRLGDAVLAHAVANAGVAAAVLLGGRWGLWG